MSQTPQAGPSTASLVSGYGSTIRVAKETYTNPLVAKGDDWTKSLVQLAKTAELKKHALTLQVHTAHILSAHASLDEKDKALQDVKEQKNRLESERARLLNCLREVNEDRDKVDILEATINKECDDLRSRIQQITEGDYNSAKSEVDRLRQELGQEPMPSLQHMLEEKSAAYLRGRRLNASTDVSGPIPKKRTAATPRPEETSATESPAKRPRGRPRGSKNKNKGSGGNDD
ncbi:hypothetical protein M422DRAFT_60119 [Sphaerobolus stellatus SS14]|uniref:Uncharacterized protein n=1 Tax=Sphaerobolus stellatus (strain SS14) TaxID=990650 RepID=A0A0C9W077_SPHS4|nr:hypothetical protein M422DRAFT_60119 [Sphaerobolus stellatus SS14]